ncbi:PCI domain-containing protein 2 homolog [Caenorhabditis elegans]|uniref:PCI domain-containing protein 2 homolog n=1 Tax=Caenorhabditis elegans TaxID=6239 RepID=PCID2_CAEEL|nr:PCI domain-containing protein 2 homolog [Caenorhabditis elegans]Q95QU0.1 RecName: Full=PCI domain-containing protein 2 homolog; AltName: Full=CSN12-like protein [Caenorhabditis elegans]CCD65746.1 PCI domain-containing protein 2 homolog [Caenorhabditis elegans]|eukprot:NP_498057.1 PCI domain-containing protein 2 homolog [Caenorhabditis elegans]
MPSVRSIEDYFGQIESLLYRQDWTNGEKISKFVSTYDEHAQEPFMHIEAYGSRSKRCRVSEDEVFDEIVCLHLHVLYNIHVAQDLITAQSTQIQIIQLFNKEILQKRKDENWFLPIFYRLCTDLRWLSKGAEACVSGDDEGDSNANSFFESAAKAITECYRTCVSDVHAEEGTTKKVAMLNMTNQLFQIYFQINKLNLLKPLIRAIDNCGSLYHDFLMSDKVAYNYFLGRKAMFDADLNLAEKSLLYAFRNCPADSMSNKRKILIYLIPVKMFLGHMPTSQLLHEYRLDEFQDVVAGVKDGNLAQLDGALAANEAFFIKCGIFLMLEKLRMITFRTLFKKVSQIVGTAQIPLDAFQTALRFVGVTDVDMDELECIIANLIASKKIKGYLSHQHQKLVISKMNAFPTLSGVSSN